VAAQVIEYLAERRAVAGTIDIRMVAEQLAQQGRACARQAGDIDQAFV
jgi:hypothetical protein